MAIKFTDLPQLSGTPADTDIVAIVDVSEDVSKKITVADLVSATGLDAASVRTIVEGSDLDMGSNKVLFSNMYATEGDLPDATSYHGMFAHVHATGAAYFAHGGSWVKLANFADMPSAVDTSAIEADIDALEAKVGSSDLTTPSTASSITYQEVLGAVHTVVTTASDKITWRQSDNYASTVTVDRFNTNNTRWDQNFEPNRGTIGTDDALIMAFEDESKIVEYPLDANAINNDNPSVEYNGLSAGDNIGKYVRCMYADDDILVAATGDGTGFVYIWTRGANGSTPISISRPGSSSDWESWGSSVKRVNDYLIVGGYKLFTVHNLDGSFVQTVGPFGSVLPDSNAYVGGQPSISGSVAIANYGNTLVMGAPNTDSTKGRAMVFDLNDLSLPPTVLSPPTPRAGQHFGISCDISDDYIVIGGHQHSNGSGDHRGRVAVYDRSSLNLIKNIIPEGNYLHYQGKFGTSVSIRGNTLLVGAKGIEPFSNGLRGGILIFDLTDLDAAPTIFAGPDGDQNFPRVMSVSANVNVTQTVNSTIIPSADVSSAINYLEDKTNDMQASIAAAATSADIATAKSEAISTAAADATTKADQAEADAKAYADQVVAATIDAAPASLDTLNELAAALNDDANFASTVTASIATKADQVDLVAVQQSVSDLQTSSSSGGDLTTPYVSSEITYDENVGSQQYFASRYYNQSTGATNQVVVYDSSDLSNSKIVTPTGPSHGSIGYIKISRTHLIATNTHSDDVSVFDLSSVFAGSTTPSYTMRFNSDLNGTYAADINGDYTYAYGPSSYYARMYRRNPNGSISQIAMEGGFSSKIKAIKTFNDLTYIVWTESDAPQATKVRIYDSNGSSTATHTLDQTGFVPVAGDREALAISNTILALRSNDRQTIKVWNMTNLSASPVTLSPSGQYFRSVAASDDYFIAVHDQNGEISVYSTSNLSGTPTTLTAPSYIASGSNIKDIQVSGRKLFVGFSNPGVIYSYDLDDLSADPVIVTGGSSYGLGEFLDVSVAENLVVTRTENIIPNSSVSASINYLEDKTNDMQISIAAAPTSADIATAKSEAISTAAADATAKADQAEADAKAYADQVVAATVDAAPASLDTLNELAAALNDDANFASTVTASIATKADASALDAKADQTELDTLDAFVKGSGTSHFNAPDASYWTINTNGSIQVNDDLFSLSPASNSTFGGAITNSVAVRASELLTVGDEYTVSFYGAPAIGITNAVWKIVVHGANLTPSSDIIAEFEFTSAGNHSFTFTSPDDRVYISITTPSGDESNQRASWIRNLDITSPSSLDTTATQIVPAINELYAEISSSSSSIQTSSDVDAGDTAADGDVLMYDASSSHFGYVNLEGEVNSRVDAKIATTSVQGLSDVASSGEDTLAGGDFLLYDASTSKFGLVNFESEVQSYANAAANTAVANVVDAAPASLDTLNELAAALGDDANFASTVTASIATKADASALDAKADQTELDSLDAFVKGSGVSHLANQSNNPAYPADPNTWNRVHSGAVYSLLENGNSRFEVPSRDLDSNYGVSGWIAQTQPVADPALVVGNDYTVNLTVESVEHNDLVVLVGVVSNTTYSVEHTYQTITVPVGSSPVDISVPFTAVDTWVTIQLSSPAGWGTFEISGLEAVSESTLETTATQIVPAINELHAEMVSSSEVTALIDSDYIQANMPAHITDINYIQTTRIDMAQNGTLNAKLGTADFEGSIVNFGSATVTGLNVNSNIDAHLNVSAANTNEFLKWNGTDYEFTDYIQGRVASTQIEVGDGGSITASLPSSTLDWQDGLVHFGGSEVIIDETPTSANHAANKAYVDTVVAATVDAAPAALDTLNELAAALGDDANFASTVTASIATKANQTDLDALQTQVNTHPLYSTLGDLPDASANHGMFAHVHSEGAAYYAHAGVWVKLANHSDISSADVDALESLVKGVNTVTGTTVSLDPVNGKYVVHSLTGPTTYTYAAGWEQGESVLLHVVINGNEIEWPDTHWVSDHGLAPVLDNTYGGTHLIELWKVGSSVYGSYLGESVLAEPPVISSASIESSYTLVEGNTTVITASASDSIGQGLTWSYVVSSGSLEDTAVTQADNVFNVVPGSVDASFELLITAIDNVGQQTSTVAAFSYDYNAAPVVSGISSSYSLTQGQDTVITASATDADGDSVSWSYTLTSGNMRDTSVSQAGNVFTITPGSTDATFEISFIATDSAGKVSSVESNFTYDYVAPADPYWFVSTVQFGRSASNQSNGGLVLLVEENGAQTVIHPSDSTADQLFGSGIDASSTHFVVGNVHNDAAGDNAGAMYLFDRNGTQIARRTSPYAAANAQFGSTVAIRGNKYVGYAPNNGSQYILVYDVDNISAAPVKIDVPANMSSWGNTGIAISDDKIFVPAVPTDGSGNIIDGGVRLYSYNFDGSGETIVATGTSLGVSRINPNGALYGSSVIHWDDTNNKVVLSVAKDDTGAEQAGSIFIMDQDGSNVVTLRSPSPFYRENFGYTVAVSGGYLVTSTYSAWNTSTSDNDYQGSNVYVYSTSGGALLTSWSKNNLSGYGVSSAIAGEKIIIGSPYENNNEGVVYLYNLDGTGEFRDVDGAGSFINGLARFGQNISGPSLAQLAPANTAPTVSGIDASYTMVPSSGDTVISATATDADGDPVTFTYAITSGSVSDTSISQDGGTFTITSGSTDTSFQMTITATDAQGNQTDTITSVAIATPVPVQYAITETGNNGSVFIYNESDLTTPVATVAGVGEGFGQYINVADNKLFVGRTSNADAGPRTGKVSVFDLGDLSAPSVELAPSNLMTESMFGGRMASGNGKIYFGSPEWGGTSSNLLRRGIVYVYDTDTLQHIQTLNTPISGTSGNYKQFGGNLLYHNQKLYVQMKYADGNMGSVYVYDTNDLSAAPFVLKPSSGAPSWSMFGWSMAVTGNDKLIVGTNKNEMYMFDTNNLTTYGQFVPRPSGVGTGNNDRFGHNLSGATSGTHSTKFVTGAYGYGYDQESKWHGAIIVYDTDDLSNMTMISGDSIRQYLDNPAGDSIQFGAATAIDSENDRILVRVQYGDVGATTNAGVVLAFDMNNLSAAPTKMTSPAPGQSYYFGYDIEVFGG